MSALAPRLSSISNYIRPSNYNLAEICNELTNGNGFFVLRGAFSQSDIETAKSKVGYLTKHKRIDTNTDHSQSGRHNSYGDSSGGIVWRLLGQDRIFDKLAQHPVTLEISRAILGPKCQISSYMSNTVKPGMGGQLPHLDYPYYDGFFPTKDANSPRPLLSIAFMIMLSEFNVSNGGTAFRPGSQRHPTYPHDVEDFYRNMVQLEGEPGDVGVFTAATQHCAMENIGTAPRIGIVQSMTPVYVKPYHDIKVPDEEDLDPEMRNLLAVDHPYPMKHG